MGAVQEDPDDPDPSDFPAGTIQIEIPETLPSTGYVGMPVLVRPDKERDGEKQDPRTDVGGPDGSPVRLR